jgi:hypothetical protein
MGTRFLNELAAIGMTMPPFGLDMRCRAGIRIAKRCIGCQALFLG